MPQPAGDPRAQHKRPPTRLVLWHLQPCWVIILLSLAAPLVLRAEQYQELLISQPTSARWQYLLGSYLFLQLAFQGSLRALLHFDDRPPPARLGRLVVAPEMRVVARERAIVAATTINLGFMLCALGRALRVLSRLPSVDTTSLWVLFVTAPLISALGYRLFRDRRALWRGVCCVWDWLQKHVLNTSPPELSFPPVQGRPVSEGPVNPQASDPSSTRTVFIPPSRQELLRGAGGIGGLGTSKRDPGIKTGTLADLPGSIVRQNIPLFIHILIRLLAPLAPFLAAILLAPFLIGTLIFDPITQGWTLGPIAVVFYIATLWLLGITALIIASRRYYIPIFIVLILLAVVFGLAGWGDNHDVRRADTDIGSPQPASDPALRPSLTDVVARWKERSLQQSPDVAALPLIVVATAGGGQRAALWTATVLSKLEAGNPLFRQQVLAISGVSGGALGATLFVAADGAAATAEQRFERLKTLFASDFLTPLVVRFLSTDILQQFFPVAVFSDRAATLEQTWEQAWAHVFEDRPQLISQPFLHLWPHDQPWPALLLNGTWVENGRRIIASNIRMGADFDAHDVLEVLHHDVPVSTAVNMSTRFPYVTPAGVVRTPDNRVFGHVVDGGYFENFGATTAVEVLRAATAYLAEHGDSVAIAPIVVMITSDPEWKDGVPPPIAQPLAKSGPTSQLTAPIEALDAVRTEHGKPAVAALKVAAGPSQDRFFHFRLCEESDKRKPILGWAFDPTTIDQIVDQRDRCGNDAEFARFAAVLGGFEPTAQP
ncbi:membrane hypothetical protein [Candidatus Defluviicoccus seviourii]|uniref:PNPLA domain-containing protein n=1 Tax=Candidatus Defluviicoccus seviourii TaxID=2565273 RepID=A0A564WF46_9PROT|nr:membrane hypothetical protein [Candidatus Defluviicoccus seviourii]